MNLYRLHRQCLKAPVLSMIPTVQDLVEYATCVSHGEIPMPGGDTAYQWSYDNPSLTSRSYQQVVASECLKQIFH